MLEIPLNATVVCVDGPVGKSTHVIIDPKSRAVSHIVVKADKDFVGHDWLIPLKNIVASTHDHIRLDLTKAEVAKLQPFSETHYVGYGYEDYDTPYAPDYMGMSGPYMVPTASTAYIPMVDESVPQGERALMQGATVEATDGKVGTVGELVVDEDGKITHFTLQEGHFWGKREVTLPLSVVDHAEESTVFLKLNKEAIKALPAVPRKGKPDKKGQRAARYEFIARIFDDPNKAAEALAFAKELQRQQHGAVKIHNSALLVKDANGKLTVTETGNLNPKTGGWIGAIGGGLLGALAGPVGIVIGAAAGAGLGRASTRWLDLGLPDEFVKEFQDQLQPNHSALILLVEHEYLKPLSESMAGLEGIVMHYTLTDSVVEKMLKEQAG